MLFAFLLITNFVYFISSAYVICSNDGSHFALVSALVEQKSVKIRDFISYTEMMDYAYKDGEYYSDRAPGTAFLSIPFYILGKILRETGIGKYLSGHENICEVFVIFLPNIAGTLAVFLLFKLLTFFGFGFGPSLFSSLLFAFTTLAWFESTHLFSHAISMLMVLGAVYLVVTTKRLDSAHMRHFLGMSALLSFASITEIQNVLLIGPFLLYVLLSRKIDVRKILNRDVLVPLLLAMLLFIAIYSSLLVYNFVAFNEMTIKSNKYNPNFPEERSFATSLSGDFLVGLDRLFTNVFNSEVILDWTKGTRNNTPGVLVTSPILLLSLIGFYYLFRTKRHETFFFLLLILTEAVIVSLHRTVLTRHVTTVLPFVFLPVVFVVKGSFEQLGNTGNSLLKRCWLLSLILILSVLSAARVFYIMNTYWGRSELPPFIFAREIPSYLFFYGSLFLIHQSLRLCMSKHGGKLSLSASMGAFLAWVRLFVLCFGISGKFRRSAGLISAVLRLTGLEMGFQQFPHSSSGHF